MKILHCTDFHYHLPWFEWLTKVSTDYDACCVSGDLLTQRDATPQQLEVQIEWVTAWARRFPGTLFLCSGNHDLVNDEYENPAWMKTLGEAWTDGHMKLVRGVWIRALGWTDWIEDEPLGPEVIVAHAGPQRTKVTVSTSDGRSYPDCELHIPLSDRGAVVLCGHVHSPKRWWDYCGTSLCLNPGCDFSEAVPNHIVVDTSRRKATHIAGGRVRETIAFKRCVHS